MRYETFFGGNTIETNRRLLSKMRTRDFYYVKRFKILQEMKKRYVLTNEKVKNKLYELLSDNDFDKIFYVKVGLTDEEKREIGDDVERILEIANVSSERLYNIDPNPFTKFLYEQEKMTIAYVVQCHFPLTMERAKYLVKEAPTLKDHLPELISEGIVGIIHALHGFNTERGVKFVTYAFNWVRFFSNKRMQAIVRDSNAQNGSLDKYRFKGKVYSGEYRDYVKDLHNSKIDFINEFPDYDFISEKTLSREWNSFLSKHSDRKRFLKMAASLDDPSICGVMSKPVEERLVARMVCEKLIPSMIDCGMENHGMGSEITTFDSVYSTKAFEVKSVDTERMVETLLASENFTDGEKNLIRSFLIGEKSTIPKKTADKIRFILSEKYGREGISCVLAS